MRNWVVIVWYLGAWVEYDFDRETQAIEFQKDLGLFGYITVRYMRRAW